MDRAQSLLLSICLPNSRQLQQSKRSEPHIMEKFCVDELIKETNLKHVAFTFMYLTASRWNFKQLVSLNLAKLSIIFRGIDPQEKSNVREILENGLFSHAICKERSDLSSHCTVSVHMVELWSCTYGLKSDFE